jgi:hypothetical protein
MAIKGNIIFKGWATKEQLERLVALELLTQEEFNTIVSEQ